MNFEPTNINIGGGSVAMPQPPREAIRALVKGILAAQGQNEPFSDDDTLAEIGIGSVDMVALLLAVESSFDLEVPQHEITIDVFRSISTLDAMVRRLRPNEVCLNVPAAAVHAPMTRVLCDNVAV
jgi:acyl carrier protein